jgi:hypothetical protein
MLTAICANAPREKTSNATENNNERIASLVRIVIPPANSLFVVVPVNQEVPGVERSGGSVH